LFAGIGGFDIGFEEAGWRTKWQVEINPTNRAVLADRFPHAAQFEDVRKVGKTELGYVDCVTGRVPLPGHLGQWQRQAIRKKPRPVGRAEWFVL
jgi:site-specific DNA-cytosine methylase